MQRSTNEAISVSAKAAVRRAWNWRLPCMALLLLLVIAKPATVGDPLSAIILIAVGSLAITSIFRSRQRWPGFDTVLLLLVPSYLVDLGWITPGVVEQAGRLVNGPDLITAFVTVMIAGSLAAMERDEMLRALLRIGPLLILSNLIAACFAVIVAIAIGITVSDAIFLTIVPAMSGGVSAGVLPLSFAYGQLWGLPPGDFVARLMPPVISANLLAIGLAGATRLMSRSAEPAMEMVFASKATEPAPDWGASAVAIAVLFTCYILGKAMTAAQVIVPSPVVTILIVLGLQISGFLAPGTRIVLVRVSRLAGRHFTGLVLFSVGLLFIPWDSLYSGFGTVNLVVIAALVTGLAISGWFLGPLLSFRPRDASLLATSRVAMGGTGDVAILSAGNRMDLMALAQVSTRLGGVATVAAALAATGLPPL